MNLRFERSWINFESSVPHFLSPDWCKAFASFLTSSSLISFDVGRSYWANVNNNRLIGPLVSLEISFSSERSNTKFENSFFLWMMNLCLCYILDRDWRCILTVYLILSLKFRWERFHPLIDCWLLVEIHCSRIQLVNREDLGLIYEN